MRLAYFFILFSLIFIVGCEETITSNTTEIDNFTDDGLPIPKEFCGWNTGAECEKDSECVVGGCSGHVCGSIGEEIITTCEYTECYNAERYNVKCECVEGICSWN